MRNKTLTIGIVLILLALLTGGTVFLRSRGVEEKAELPAVEEEVEEVSSESLGLTLSARGDKKAVKFEMTNIRDIASIDYELSYLAKGDIPRGVIGHIDVNPAEKKIASDFLDLGSCSRSVCKYDEGVTSVKLVVKITKTDGKMLQAKKELAL